MERETAGGGGTPQPTRTCSARLTWRMFSRIASLLDSPSCAHLFQAGFCDFALAKWFLTSAQEAFPREAFKSHSPLTQGHSPVPFLVTLHLHFSLAWKEKRSIGEREV